MSSTDWPMSPDASWGLQRPIREVQLILQVQVEDYTLLLVLITVPGTNTDTGMGIR